MRLAVLAFLSLLATTAAADGNDDHFGPMDVFGLEWVTDPQISPDGSRIVYVRNFMDVMTDARRSNLWILDAEGADHRPVASGPESQSSPRWSPDGKRLAYVSSADGSSQIFVRWMDSETTARVTNLTSAPSGLTWSPDGRLLAFSMHVPSKPVPFVEMPQRPEGAEWAPPPKVITKLQYRFDGQGYLKDGYYHLFVVPSEGGTPPASSPRASSTIGMLLRGVRTASLWCSRPIVMRTGSMSPSTPRSTKCPWATVGSRS